MYLFLRSAVCRTSHSGVPPTTPSQHPGSGRGERALHPRDDLTEVIAWAKDLPHAEGCEPRQIFVGDDAAAKDGDVRGRARRELRDDCGEERVVRATHDGQPDG